MTARVWPVAAVTGSPTYDGRYLRQTTVAPFLLGATAARPLGARSGVRPGTSTSTVTATSTTWSVAAHAGVIDGESANEAGPYAYSFDAVVSGSMTAANATYARIDLISVQVSDPAESDGSSTPSIAIVYTTGTAAPSPAVPTTPARAFNLAQINVPASGGGAPSVVWVAPYLTAAGAVIPVRNTTERNAAASALGASAAQPVRAWRADATALRQQEFTIDGSTWSYVPATLGIQTWTTYLSTGSIGAGYANGTYTVVGNLCIWSLDLSFGTGATAGSGSYQWNLPVAAATGNLTVGQGYYYNGAFQTFFCQYQGASQMLMRAGGGTSNTWGSSYAPIAVGNVGNFSGSYLIA